MKGYVYDWTYALSGCKISVEAVVCGNQVVKVEGKDSERFMRDFGTSCLRKGIAFNDA